MRSTMIGLAAAIVTVAIGVTLVKAQLIFADGTVQTTAAVARSSIAPGSEYISYGVINTVSTGGTTVHVLTPTVPAGKELVVLQIKYFQGITTAVGDGRIDAIIVGTWNQVANLPNFVSFLVPPHDAGTSSYSSRYVSVDNDYIDGTLIVSAGNVLVTDPFSTSNEISVLGYFRDVP